MNPRRLRVSSVCARSEHCPTVSFYVSDLLPFRLFDRCPFRPFEGLVWYLEEVVCDDCGLINQ